MLFKKLKSIGDILNFEEGKDPFRKDFSSKHEADPELDLSKVLIYGYEKNQSLEVVSYLSSAVECGEELPRVPVTQISHNEYCLIPGFVKSGYGIIEDGGHHRVLAYSLAQKSLPVSIYDCEVPGRVNIPMDGSTIISNPKALEERIKRDSNYNAYCDD